MFFLISLLSLSQATQYQLTFSQTNRHALQGHSSALYETLENYSYTYPAFEAFDHALGGGSPASKALQVALPSFPRCDAFVTPWPGDSPVTVLQSVEQMATRPQIIYIRVGPDQGWSALGQSNCDYIQSLFAECVTRFGHGRCGIRSQAADWTRAFGSKEACRGWDGVPLWWDYIDSHYDLMSWEPFGGFKKSNIVIKSCESVVAGEYQYDRGIRF